MQMYMTAADEVGRCLEQNGIKLNLCTGLMVIHGYTEKGWEVLKCLASKVKFKTRNLSILAFAAFLTQVTQSLDFRYIVEAV